MALRLASLPSLAATRAMSRSLARPLPGSLGLRPTPPKPSSSPSSFSYSTSPKPKGKPHPSSSPPASKYKSSGMVRPTVRPDPSQPLVIYQGPAQYRPLISHFLLLVFSVIGITTGANVQKHAVWPLWPTKDGREQKLLDERLRYALGAAVAVAGVGLGSLFKWAAAKNITRITLVEKGGKPLLNIKVASPPLFTRELIRRGHPRSIISGRGDPEFTVALSSVVRTTGSAVASGWVDERTSGRDRRTITLQIGTNGSEAYQLEAAGTVEPTRENTGGAVSYWFRVFDWAFIRGRPDPPYFWSRQAFDELLPPAGPRIPK